jgi:hypothetical protein
MTAIRCDRVSICVTMELCGMASRPCASLGHRAGEWCYDKQGYTIKSGRFAQSARADSVTIQNRCHLHGPRRETC